jgi:hypothetical protein
MVWQRSGQYGWLDLRSMFALRREFARHQFLMQMPSLLSK